MNYRNNFAHLFIQFVAFVGCSSQSAAQDDRENTDITKWQWRHGKTSAQIEAEIAKGYRLVDIEVDSTVPLRFAASFVHNSGTYYKGVYKVGWRFHAAIAPTALSATLALSNHRLISLAPYVLNGSVTFAAVTVKKQGKDNKASWWNYNMTGAGIKAAYQKNGARIIDLDSYVFRGRRYFSSVTIENSGTDYRPWWWYTNLTFAAAKAKAAQHGARMYDLERRSSGTYDVVLIRNPGYRSWRYIGVTESRLNEIWRENGARISDIETYTSGGTKHFVALMLDNVNALTSRVGAILRNGSDGSPGLVLKRIGGSTRAGLQTSYAFDPASLLKTLHHMYAMWWVSVNQAKLTDLLQYGGGSCPYTTAVPAEPLSLVLRQMMENSSNSRTIWIERWAGFGLMNIGRLKINDFGTAIGMTNTKIIRTIGCGGLDNRMTLRDLITLHEEVAGGYLGKYRETFIDLMLNSVDSYPGFGNQRLNLVLFEEAAKLNLTNNQLVDFKSRMRMAYKPGSLPKDGKFDRTIGGWLSLPFIVGNEVEDREYVTGVFLDNASVSEDAKQVVATAATELLREEIRAAMKTWKNFVFGAFTGIGTSCKGSTHTPSQIASGMPFIGKSVDYRLIFAPSRNPVVLNVGTSKSQWNSIPLPMDLQLIGAPNCFAYTNSVAQIGGLTKSGSAKVTFNIPNDKALIGGQFYTQYWLADSKANSFGWITTNAIGTKIGGTK